jgi:hypothetical protein
MEWLMFKDPERAVTAAAREAHKAFWVVEGKLAMDDYAKSQKALHENRKRLKAERLAREADTMKATQ